MPSATRYVPPTDLARNSFMAEVEQERRTRRERYQTALKYYLGEQPEQLAYDPDSDLFNENTVINMVQMTADRTVGFLFPSMPLFETDPASIEDTPEEIWIRKFFTANGGLQALVKLGLRGFLSGHAFIRVKPAPARKRRRKDVFPTMTVLDPTTVTVYWRADDVADVVWYELRYMKDGEVIIQDFVKDEPNDRWLIYTYHSIGQQDNNNPFPGDVTPHGSSHVIGLDLLEFNDTHPFEQIGGIAYHNSTIPPIIEFPHLPHPDDYYGLGEFTQQTLQDTINRIVSLRNRLVSENAEPVDVVIGAAPDDVERSKSVLTVNNPAAKITRLELKSDLEGINATLDKLIETYLAVARVVLLKGEAKDLQRVTNASVRTLFLDALSKNELLQAAYGFGLQQLTKLALLMGFEAGAISTNPQSLDVDVKFPVPLPTDLTEIANQNAIMVQMGARSKRTAAKHMGDDWKFELAAMLAEQEQEREKMLKDGEVAAENAGKLADAMPEPTTKPPKPKNDS